MPTDNDYGPKERAAIRQRLTDAEHDHAVAAIRADINLTEAKLALLRARLADAIAT